MTHTAKSVRQLGLNEASELPHSLKALVEG